jgi:hypothetical protein
MRSRILAFLLTAVVATSALTGRAERTNDQVFRFRRIADGMESLLVVYENGSINHIYHPIGETIPKKQSYSIWRTVPIGQLTIILRRLRDAGIESIKPDTEANSLLSEPHVYWKNWKFFDERCVPKAKAAAITAIVSDLFKQLNLDKPTPMDFTPKSPE